MKWAERIVIVVLLFAIFGGAVWMYVATQSNRKEVRDAVARGEYEIPIVQENEGESVNQDGWRVYYPVTVPVTIGTTTVLASVADTLPERIKGLSDTPYLPEGVVKLFAFGSEGPHAIWMKDMQYAIDIIWADKEGKIVHIEENVRPESYPDSFSSPTPAWYVVETNAGFVERSGVMKGDLITVSE